MSISANIYSRLPDALFDTVFSDRHMQFMSRHKWDLCATPEGYEIDEYDGYGTEYLVVHSNGNHLTSCRLRPFALSTMLLDHFSDVFPAARSFVRSQPGHLYELSRYLRAPSLTVRQGTAAQMAFANALDRFRDDREVTGFLAVVYPEVSRFLRQSGVRFLIIGASVINGHRIEMICITQAVAGSRLRDRQQVFAQSNSGPRPMSGRVYATEHSIPA
ncbi:MAG: acyl-homoserine-lactone synthase [Parvularcula sp.]|jgi:N-acyl-L-homoserine lactone synthetase|nr:acyl-homoserine-lactone synthase [Parvularcula sp.]